MAILKSFLIISLLVCPLLQIDMIAGEKPMDINLVAMLADTHVGSGSKLENIRNGMKRCVDEILALNPRPANVLVLGDLILRSGKDLTIDYRVFQEILAPLKKAGVEVHITLGNHDRREPFYEVLPEYKEKSPVPGYTAAFLETPFVDFIVLDSLKEGLGTGEISQAQLDWLGIQLANRTKPAFVCLHHPLYQIRDSKKQGLAELLSRTAGLAGVIHGHRHYWYRHNEKGVEELSLPTTGRIKDVGYTHVRLSADQAVFEFIQHGYVLHPSELAALGKEATAEQKEAAVQAHMDETRGARWVVPLP